MLYLTKKPEKLSLKLCLNIIQQILLWIQCFQKLAVSEYKLVFPRLLLIWWCLTQDVVKCTDTFCCFPTQSHDSFPCVSVLCLYIYTPVCMHRAMYMLFVCGFGFNIRFYKWIKILSSFYCSPKGQHGMDSVNLTIHVAD